MPKFTGTIEKPKLPNDKCVRSETYPDWCIDLNPESGHYGSKIGYSESYGVWTYIYKLTDSEIKKVISGKINFLAEYKEEFIALQIHNYIKELEKVLTLKEGLKIIGFRKDEVGNPSEFFDKLDLKLDYIEDSGFNYKGYSFVIRGKWG